MWVTVDHIDTKIVTKTLGRADRAWHIDRITWQIDYTSLDRVATLPGHTGCMGRYRRVTDDSLYRSFASSLLMKTIMI